MKLALGARTKQLLDGEMTVIRKDIPSSLPKRRRFFLNRGESIDAFNVQPDKGGKPVAIVKIVSVEWEPAYVLLENPQYAEAEMHREGGIWPNLDAYLAYVSRMYSPHRIAFELVGKYTSDRMVDYVNDREGQRQREHVA